MRAPPLPPADRGAAPPAGARLVVALGIAQIVSWGSLYYAFALIVDKLAAAVDARPAVVVGAYSVALLITGLASAPFGALIDRHGGRWVMSAGSLAAALLLPLLGHVSSVLELYLVWAALGVTMAATLYDPAFAVLGQAFGAGQRRAITAVTLFGGFASTVFWPLTQALVQAFGWQTALLVLGAINGLVALPLHALVLPSRRASTQASASPAADDVASRPAAATSAPAAGSGGAPSSAPRAPDVAGGHGSTAAPADPRHAPGRAASAAADVARPAGSIDDWRAAVRDPAFLRLAVAFTGNALVFSGMTVHLIPVLHAKGWSLAEAAWIGALVGPMQVLGRIAEYRWLPDWSASKVGVIAMWLLPVSLVLLALLGGSMVWIGVFALLYGSGNGVMTIVRGAIPAELYGRAAYGAINGALSAPVLISKAAGPLVGSLLLAAALGPTAMVLLLAGLAGLAAAFFTWTIRRRAPDAVPVGMVPSSRF
ncbi:MFS transporter [Piscinibacter koreensis]|uniref:MFS transporter n=1 Tax=Piscinibacter koreensis TaxID=2742824 RepID=A0A7Y6NJS2_9BURK|nr:MFS transporter [Schlegelella koreensis]NUZ04483.1 MFS transporter [Schlegelella koreensis]